MDDDDDELDGLSPTSMWRRNRKRKDYSDDEDYKPDKEEEVQKKEAEEGEYKPSINIAPLATAPPSPIAVAGVSVNMSLGNKRRTARMSTGGKAPRRALASKNVVSTLIDREFRRATQENYPGEWDRKIPNKKVPSPEWKPCKETVEKNLMQKLGEAANKFEQAYNLMMSIIGDLEENYYEDKKKEERKF
jgi:hypothetical protein